MKSGLQPWIGCGFHDGCRGAGEPSALRSCFVPLVTIGASAGSATNDLRLGTFLVEHARHALERAAGAEARHPVVEPLAREVGDDLRAVVREWIVGVRFVLELAREEPAVLLRQLDRLLHHARPAVRRRRENDLRAEEAHQLATLDAERLGHRHDERISLRAHTMASPMPVLPLVASITVCPGLSAPVRLRVFDDAERETILDRAEWIEGLDLRRRDRRPAARACPILTTGVLPTVSRMLAKRVIGRTWF